MALRAAQTRPETIRAMILVAPAVLNPLDRRFLVGSQPGNLLQRAGRLRSSVEMTAKLAAFNLQVRAGGGVAKGVAKGVALVGRCARGRGRR